MMLEVAVDADEEWDSKSGWKQLARDGPPIETIRGYGYRLVPPPRDPLPPPRDPLPAPSVDAPG